MALALVPREYQQWALDALLKWFEDNATGNPLIVMPTGTGKAVEIAMLIEYVLSRWPTQKILVSTHVQELVEQNYIKMKTLWPQCPAGVYSAGLKRRDTHHPVIFNSIQSIAGKAGALFGHVDLMIIDEAHLVSPEVTTSYQKVIKALLAINPKMRVIGLTATPWRLGHGSLVENHIFTDIAFDCSTYEAFNWFLEQGYLLPPVPGTVETRISVEGVAKQGGEFISAQLQTAVDKDEITEHICRETIEHGKDRHSWLVFATGVEHAEHMADCFNSLGIPTIAIHSKMKGDRTQALQDYINGKYRCAVNNNVLTTGFDHPGLDLICVARPTESPVLWVQMLGRGTRPLFVAGFDLLTQQGRLDSIAASQKQNTLVLDFAGNTRRLGPINDPVVPTRKGKGGGDAPVKDCPVCQCTVHASLRICPGIKSDGTVCGYEFPIATKLHLAASTAPLVKGNLPVVEIFKVDHVTYALHTKGDLSMVKVSYHCGHRGFDEYVCVEHEGFAARKAKQWWRLRSKEDMPVTAAEMLEVVGGLPPATHLRVWINKKYPEIMAQDLTGTAFGTKEKEPQVPLVDVSHRGLISLHELKQQATKSEGYVQLHTPEKEPGWDAMDDDIPF